MRSFRWLLWFEAAALITAVALDRWYSTHGTTAGLARDDCVLHTRTCRALGLSTVALVVVLAVTAACISVNIGIPRAWLIGTVVYGSAIVAASYIALHVASDLGVKVDNAVFIVDPNNTSWGVSFDLLLFAGILHVAISIAYVALRARLQ